MIRAVSVLGFAAVAIVAASLGLKTGETDEQVADIVPAAASVEFAPDGPIALPAQSISLDKAPQAGAPLQKKTRGLSTQTAQQNVSNKCRVPNGSVCYVRAKTVGASCSCPGVTAEGVIVK